MLTKIRQWLWGKGCNKKETSIEETSIEQILDKPFQTIYKHFVKELRKNNGLK